MCSTDLLESELDLQKMHRMGLSTVTADGLC